MFAAVFMLLFSVMWTTIALTMPGGDGPFALIKVMFGLFGFMFIALSVYLLVKALRQRPSYGPVTPQKKEEPKENPVSYGLGYCPGCGSPLEPNYDFCRACGRRLK